MNQKVKTYIAILEADADLTELQCLLNTFFSLNLYKLEAAASCAQT